MALTPEGNKAALPTEAIFGTNPCWCICLNAEEKSGGAIEPVTISTSPSFSLLITDVQSCRPEGYLPGSIAFQPLAWNISVCFFDMAIPSASFGHMIPKVLLVWSIFSSQTFMKDCVAALKLIPA